MANLRAPVRRSLLRKITWMGGDRRIVGLSGMVLGCLSYAMVFGFGFMFGLPVIGPLIVFAVIVWGAKEAHNSDPYLVDVMVRQMKYPRYLAPQPDIAAEHPDVKRFVK